LKTNADPQQLLLFLVLRDHDVEAGPVSHVRDRAEAGQLPACDRHEEEATAAEADRAADPARRILQVVQPLAPGLGHN